MHFLLHITHRKIAKGIGGGAVEDRFCGRIKEFNGHVFHTVTIDVFKRSTRDIHGIAFGKERGVEQFGGVALENQGPAHHSKKAADEDERCCEVSPPVCVPVDHGVPFILRFGGGRFKFGRADHEFVLDLAGECGFFFRLHPRTKGFHALFAFGVHGALLFRPVRARIRPLSLSTAYIHQGFPFHSTTKISPRTENSPTAANTARLLEPVSSSDAVLLGVSLGSVVFSARSLSSAMSTKA